jgi:hypothetical protein
MSAPSKAPPEIASDRLPEASEPATTNAQPGTARGGPPPPQAALLAAQGSAGNRAVADAIAAGRGIQRAPADDDRHRSEEAHAPTVPATPGAVESAPTLPAAGPQGPAAAPAAASPAAPAPAAGADGGQPAMAPQVSGAAGPASAGGVLGPAGTPLKGQATFAGSEEEGDFSEAAPQPRRGKHPEHIKPAMPVSLSEAQAAYRKDPSSVYRSKNDSLHRQYWAIDPGTGGGPPQAYRSGKTIIIAPDLAGPGLPPPHTEPIEADEGAESRNVEALGQHLDARRAGAAGPPAPGPPSDEGRRAIFPGSRRGPETGMKPATPVSHDEVMNAYRDNPAKVHSSASDDWHGQVYAIDRGQGAVPRAYRSGSKIIVDPSYPLDGRPPAASPAGSVKPPGPGADLGSVLNPVQIPSDPAKKAEALRDPVEGPRIRDAINQQNQREHDAHMERARAGLKAKQDEARTERPIPKAMSTIAPAPINAELESDIPHDQTVRYDDDSPDIEVQSQEDKPAKWGMKGANVTRTRTSESRTSTRRQTDTTTKTRTTQAGLKGIGQEWAQRDETKTDDKVVAREKSTKANVSLKGLTITQTQSTEEGKGETADPADPDAKKKTKTSVQKGMTLGPGGAGGTGTASIESKSGTKAEATGDFKLTPGGMEGSAAGTVTSAKGFSGHLSVSGKYNVIAGDPKHLDNGKYSVTFTVTDEKGVEIGGGWSKPGGGPSASLAAGSSSSNEQFETRVFDSEPEAKLFQLFAALRVAEEVKSVKNATTADGALAMKEGESKGTSHTDTDSLSGSGGMEGVDIGVAMSDATTLGLTIKKVGPTQVQVTPSVSEKKALDASISAWSAFGNTKGHSEINAYAITFEFDLGNDAGKKAFETYCKTRMLPLPPAKWIDSTTGHQFEDHDVYTFAHIGKIGWQNTAWQQTVVDEKGTHAAAGGGQSHVVDLNWIRHVTRDKNVHSDAEITGHLENGKATGFEGQMTVGGESGSFNREQFDLIFSDTKPKGEVTNSGEWTLSADIDAKMFEQLERTNSDMRKAKTREEKLKIYSELAKKGGAHMLSGQVRGGGHRLARAQGRPQFPRAGGTRAAGPPAQGIDRPAQGQARFRVWHRARGEGDARQAQRPSQERQ